MKKRVIPLAKRAGIAREVYQKVKPDLDDDRALEDGDLNDPNAFYDLACLMGAILNDTHVTREPSDIGLFWTRLDQFFPPEHDVWQFVLRD